MQDQGNSGRPASTQGFQIGEKGFATQDTGNDVNIGVVAPLNVQAAPTAATKLAAALSTFQQQTQMPLARMAMEKAQNQMKLGEASPDPEHAVTRDKDGNVTGWNQDFFKGKDIAYANGVQRATALVLMKQGMQAVEQDIDTLRYDQQGNPRTPQDFQQLVDKKLAGVMGGLQNDAMAKEATTQIMEQFHDRMGASQLALVHTELNQHMLEGADFALHQMFAFGTPSVEAVNQIAKNLVYPAMGHDWGRTNSAMIQALGTIAADPDHPNPDVLKMVDTSSFGIAAQAQYKSAVMQAEKAFNEHTAIGTSLAKHDFITGYEHALEKGEQWPTSIFDAAYNRKDQYGHPAPLLSDEEYMRLQKEMRDNSDKFTRTQLVAAHFNRLGYDQGAARPVMDAKGRPTPAPTDKEAEENLSMTLDQRFGTDDNTRIFGGQDKNGKHIPGFLEMYADAAGKLPIDARTSYVLSHARPDDMRGAERLQQAAVYIGEKAPYLMDQLGLSKDQQAIMAQLRFDHYNNVPLQQSVDWFANTDPTQRAEMIRQGVRGFSNYFDEKFQNGSLTLDNKGGWWASWMDRSRANVGIKDVSNPQDFRQYVEPLAERLWLTGSFRTPELAAEAAVQQAQKESFAIRGSDGKALWMRWNTTTNPTVDRPMSFQRDALQHFYNTDVTQLAKQHGYDLNTVHVSMNGMAPGHLMVTGPVGDLIKNVDIEHDVMAPWQAIQHKYNSDVLDWNNRQKGRANAIWHGDFSRTPLMQPGNPDNDAPQPPKP